MSEPAFSALCRRGRGGLPEGRADHPVDDNLGNPVAPRNGEGALSQVHEEHADFSPVVGVYRPRSVENGHAVLERETGPRTDLGFGSGRKLDNDPGRDEARLPRSENDRVDNGRVEVKTRGMGCLILGKRKIETARKAHDRNWNGFFAQGEIPDRIAKSTAVPTALLPSGEIEN